MKDVLPPDDHRSIRSIPVPVNRRRHEASGVRRGPVHDDIEWDPPKRKSGRFIWVLAVIVLAILGAVAASMIFKKASVTIVPNSQVVTLPEKLTAALDAPVGELPFETVTTSNIGNRTVPASGESKVERRATGTITIMNTFSTASQRLIKNTRFEAPDGKIYRIDQSVVVPGGVKRADGTLTPGTLDTTVSADSPGDTYNRTSLDTFTIPGFKGDPRYSKITAKAKTAMQGGFVGTEKTVADGDLTAAKSAIQTELSSSLEEALKSATPSGYILVEKSASVTYEELPRGGDANAAVISLRGTAVGAIIREADLAAAVARTVDMEGYKGEALRFLDPSAVHPTVEAPYSPGQKTLTVGLSGQTRLIWQVDAGAIKQALAGTQVSALGSTLNRFRPAVADAKASLRPFWQSQFPQDAWLINVEVQDPR